MRQLKSTIILLFCCVLSVSSFARKAKLLEGSLDELKGVKKINVQFNYDHVTVSNDNIPEEEYIEKRKTELNEKEARKGDSWARMWKDNRARKYEISFRNQFNRDAKIRCGAFPEEKYTMIFKTTNIEPGYNIVMSKRPSRLTGEAWIVETANPEKVICKLLVENCPGSMPGADIDDSERLRYSYIVAADMLQAYFDKQLF